MASYSPDKFENTALFLQLSLHSTIIRSNYPTKRNLSENLRNLKKLQFKCGRKTVVMGRQFHTQNTITTSDVTSWQS